jgi:hypothetical protein
MNDRSKTETWTSIDVGDDCIGAFLNRGEFGIEAYDADDVLLGVFADEDDAGNAIFDCWDKKLRSNDGDSHDLVQEDDVPSENVIDIPADEVSAQWGKFPPGMTTAPWQPDWLYVTGSKEEAEHIESFGLPAVCRKELGPKQIPILQDADIVLLNCGRELNAALVAIARQLRVVDVPDLASCSKEEFTRLTKPHWAEGARSPEPPNGEPARDDQERESPSEAPGTSWDESFAPSDTQHICTHCKLEPPDGTERKIADNTWVHPRCKDAYINARMAEEGLAQKDVASQRTKPNGGGQRHTEDASEQPTHDKAMAADFLAGLDRNAKRFTFQFFSDDKNNKGYAEIFHGTLDEVWPKILVLNTPQRRIGVFVTICETDFRGRSTKNIVRPRALFTDADGKEQVTNCAKVIEACGVKPSLAVITGRGFHPYYFCDDISLDQFSVLQKSLIAKFGTDPAVHDLPRVMRLPGTLHLKTKTPQLVKLHRPDGAIKTWKLAELIDKLGLSTETVKSNRQVDTNENRFAGIEYPPLPFPPIKEGCPWLRDVHDTGGADQSEPLWKLANNVCVFLEDGENLIHELSKEHPGYTREETEAKFDRARTDQKAKNLGWPQCRTIHEHGSEQCKSCPHLEAGGSPLNLAQQWEQERRARQIAENIKIGDDVTEPLLPQIMTLKEMHERLVFIGSSGGVADLITGRIRKKEHAMDEYAASHHTYTETLQTKMREKTGPALKFWIASKTRTTVEVVAWVPGSPQICQPPEGPGPAFNTWRGLNPMAYPEDWQERVKPFLEHIEFLVPIKGERERFLQWLAHIVQHPEVLPHTSYLMITPTTGVGRNLLASILVRALRGFVAAGVSLPELLDNNFTGRLSKKLLVIVDEAREGSGERRYQRQVRLTSLITEEHRHINPKYGHQSIEKNCGRWLKFSNYADAIPFDESDRRVIVVSNPTVRKEDAYYERLYGLLNDRAFIGSVRRWMETKDITSFRPGEHASMNETKLRVLNEMMSETERAVVEFKEDCKFELAARDQIKNHVLIHGDAPVNDMHLTHAIRRAGIVNTGRRIKIGAAEQRITVVIIRGG